MLQALHRVAICCRFCGPVCSLALKFPTAVFSVLLLSASLVLSQEHPTLSAQSNTVFVSADGKFESPPDLAIVQFNISAQASTAKAVYEQASKEAETTREVLRSNGLEPKSAESGSYAIQPRYDWKSQYTSSSVMT
jgi:uncharacterized protein YggE